MIPASGQLYTTTANTLTLRTDFAAACGRIDALVTINETAPGVASSTAIPATRSGNTWTLPQALASYPAGNRPNTWRIRLLKAPPSGVTYHTSIMQTFVRVGEAPGKTYPPTTRQ